MINFKQYSAFALVSFIVLGAISACEYSAKSATKYTNTEVRERIRLNDGWRFFKYSNAEQADKLIYDVRPVVVDNEDGKAADAMPTEAVAVESQQKVLKSWILPTANDFIQDPAMHYKRPVGEPGKDFPFVQLNFDDKGWESVRLPHDWAIAGPFMVGDKAEVGGGMGRLPSNGVAWYRKRISIPAQDAGKAIFLDVDGAMSYAMVWINGHLAGGWPYGYASWRVDLTPYLNVGGDNQLAIRLDNPNASSRWYPGGGIYRNVWLTKTNLVHVAHSGTQITTAHVTSAQANINLHLRVDNNSKKSVTLTVVTEIFPLDVNGKVEGSSVASIVNQNAQITAGSSLNLSGSTVVNHPKLWGPPPTQTPNRYLAVTTLKAKDKTIDHYETAFGIRSVHFDANKGVFVNGEHIYLQGANQHHDLGALGSAFNYRAAERQLEMLRDMGVNAIRFAHNPPDPALLEMTDKMGFLVIDEIFDVWERKKTPLDFHLIFPEWHEADLRSFIRRDRNHPSVIMWSVGNEVGEQYTDEEGAKVAKSLYAIAKQEDSRPVIAAMNYAKPQMPLPTVFDGISLNYQGEGIRDAPAYADLKGIRTSPLYPAFHEKFPDKFIISSENAAAVSSRGEYLFPVAKEMSAPIRDGAGGNPETQQVSAYELYTAPFGSSADKVFSTLEKHPYVGGGFVWSGWDYIGEPTPYYRSRSSYFGAIDLAGFKKDRFYLYQAHWRPDLPMAHILPHWNWPDRIGKITPVHVFSSGDEAELFLNGKSLDRKHKGSYEYRFRWDDVKYQPGELKVVTYKAGKFWAEDKVKTTSAASALKLSVDRSHIQADGDDLAFVTIEVIDKDGLVVPNANNEITVNIDGAGEIVATDNGDSSNMVSFKSKVRKAFNGKLLAIVKAKQGQLGQFNLTARAHGLQNGVIAINSNL